MNMKQAPTNGAIQFLRRLWQVPSYLAAIALFTLMAMTFCDVVLRSTINNPIEAATELTRLLVAIVVFSSLPVISWQGNHIVVDLLDGATPALLARWRDAVINFFSGIILCWPIYRIWVLAERARTYGDTTEYLQIPQFYIAYFIAFATVITAITFVIRGTFFVLAPDRIPTNQGAS